MKISEFKDEEAVELLADIIEPVADIFSDDKIREIYNAKGSKMATVAAYVLKAHKKSIIQILAAMDGKTVEEYHCNVLTLPKAVMEVLNDEVFKDFFTSLLREGVGSFGGATENTGGSAN